MKDKDDCSISRDGDCDCDTDDDDGDDDAIAVAVYALISLAVIREGDDAAVVLAAARTGIGEGVGLKTTS